MGLSLATLKLLQEAGVPADRLIEIAEAIERDFTGQPTARSRAAERQARYRARRQVTPVDWEIIRQAVLLRDGVTCAYCGGESDPPHVDHVIPLIQGGTNDMENLCVACEFCNSSKAGQTVEQWRAAQ